MPFLVILKVRYELIDKGLKQHEIKKIKQRNDPIDCNT